MTTLTAAARVLRCFTPQRLELTVTDIAGLLPAPKSTASRLLRAMRDAGLLELVEGTRRYRPGVLLFETGHLYRRASTLIARADAAVARISAGCGHTGYVSIRDGLEVVGLTAHIGANALRVGTPVGQRLLAFASATGRSLLARLTDSELRDLYPAPLTPPSPNSPASLDELLHRLAEVRRTGISTSEDEANPGVGTIAVAVGDPETGEEASLCITYPLSTASETDRARISQALLQAAREIQGQLGVRDAA